MSSILRHHRANLWITGAIAVCLMGCEGSVALLPPADPALRKPPAVFSADAAKRQYEANAPKIPDSAFRAQYALVLRQVDLANISNKDCSNVEIWINGKYVVFCPSFQKKTDKSLTFRMFYDNEGHHFDTQDGHNPIQRLEVYRDGAMYTVIDHVAD